MTAMQQQPVLKQLEYTATGRRMIELMGWKWFLCALNVVEIIPTIEQVYEGEMWKVFQSPTFANDQRVRELVRLDDGTYRAQVQLSPDTDELAEIIVSADTKLTAFIPHHPSSTVEARRHG